MTIEATKINTCYVNVKPESMQLIAQVSLLERLVVHLWRANCREILIRTNDALELPICRRLGIGWQRVEEFPPADRAVLVVDSNVYTSVENLNAALSTTTATQFSSSRGALPMWVTLTWSPESEMPKDTTELSEESWLVDSPAQVKELERHYWRSLTSRSDGVVDRFFNRPLSRLLTKPLLKTSISPNQVTAIATMIGLLGAMCLATGHYWLSIVGVLLFQLSAIFDCSDGELARVLFKESKFGQLLDISADQVVHIALFFAIAWSLAQSNQDLPWLVFGVVAACGVLASFALVLKSQRLPESARPALLTMLLDGAANRDFSVVMLFFAGLGRLDLFLFMVTCGTHVYWILLALAFPRRDPTKLLEL